MQFMGDGFSGEWGAAFLPVINTPAPLQNIQDYNW
jgi:hypothetical protein